MRWMKLEPNIQSEVSQKDKEHYSICVNIYMEFRKMVMITLYAKQKKRHRCTEQTFGRCGRRRGWGVSREQHIYYLKWNGSPAQVGCMRQVLGPGTLGRPRGNRWRGRWEGGGSGWGIHVTPCLIHVNVWQNPLQYCKVISLQLIKINEKKQKRRQWIYYECWRVEKKLAPFEDIVEVLRRVYNKIFSWLLSAGPGWLPPDSCNFQW